MYIIGRSWDCGLYSTSDVYHEDNFSAKPHDNSLEGLLWYEIFWPFCSFRPAFYNYFIGFCMLNHLIFMCIIDRYSNSNHYNYSNWVTHWLFGCCTELQPLLKMIWTGSNLSLCKLRLFIMHFSQLNFFFQNTWQKVLFFSKYLTKSSNFRVKFFEERTMLWKTINCTK